MAPNLRTSLRRFVSRAGVIGILCAGIVMGTACGREPTDPARADFTGLWKSFDRDLYIYNIEMEITQIRPGVIIGKWRSLGRTDNACTPNVACKDSSVITGRTEVAQVVIDLLGAGNFVGELVSTNVIKGIIRSETRDFHVTFTRH